MTELELQRIVDGELTSADRAKLLGQLDERSPLWRTLALSLLADQDLRRCFQLSEPNTLLLTTENQSPARSARQAYWPFVLAASVLIAIVGGVWWRSGFEPATGLQPVATAAIDNRPTPKSIEKSIADPADFSQSQLVNWRPTGKMMLSAPGKSKSSVELPVYEVQQISPQAIVNQQVAKLETLTEQFQKQGWRTGLNTRVYEGRLEDGRKLFIPVNVMHLEPLSY